MHSQLKALNYADSLLGPVMNPEERTCFNCGYSECRAIQAKTCDLKETSCEEWEHDFQGMNKEVKGGMNGR